MLQPIKTPVLLPISDCGLTPSESKQVIIEFETIMRDLLTCIDNRLVGMLK